MKRKYAKAAFIGAVIGVCLIFMDAIAGSFAGYHSGFIIPIWDQTDPIYGSMNSQESGVFSKLPADYVETYKPGTLLELQHKAIVLRFLMILFDDGFWIITVPMIVSMLFVGWNQLGERNLFLACLRRGLKASGLIYLIYWLVCVVLSVADSVRTGTHPEGIAREVTTGFNFALMYAFIGLVPLWIICTIAHLFFSLTKTNKKTLPAESAET